MSLEDTVAFIAIREAEVIAATNARMPAQTVSFGNTPGDYGRNTQNATIPVAQRFTTQTGIPPSQTLSEQMEIVKVQLTVSISPSVSSARRHIAPQSPNTGQPRQLDAEAPEFYPAVGLAGGSDQEKELPRVVVAPRQDQPQTFTKGGENKPMPVAGVMQQQTIPVLDLVCTATRKQQQPQAITQTKRRRRSK